MTTTLITGANKGIGRDTARRLLELGHAVHLGARDVDRGRAAAYELGASFVQLDVTDDASVAAALDHLGRLEDHLDVLVNNAGIYDTGVGPADLTVKDSLREFDTDVVGVVRVTAPGFTATDFTAEFGGGRPVENAAEIVVRLACIGPVGPDGPTGALQEAAGPLAW